MKVGLLVAIMLLLPAGLVAHPHARADQQAHLSLGRNEAIVTYYVAPSASDGASMFGHIDKNDDGRLSRPEMSAFAHSLIAQSRLTLDGKPARLTLTHHAFPERRAMAQGHGLIRVRARAPARLGPGSRRDVAFDVTHQQFARRWFVQPFYRSDFAGTSARPIVRRRSGSNAIALTL